MHKVPKNSHEQELPRPADPSALQTPAESSGDDLAELRELARVMTVELELASAKPAGRS